MNTTRVPVDKTFKLFIKGEFVRSESGRSLPISSHDGSSITNVARASRKDARDAVLASKAGQQSWASKTAYLRGQILYRLAEVMEGRRAELTDSLTAAGARDPRREVDAAIDRTIHYAGWSDKIHALLSTLNPVAGPHYDVTSPEPMGVVVVAPPDGDAPILLVLVSTILPVIIGGNAALVVAPESDPKTTVVWCECLATSDMPAGVVNVLTGLRAEVIPPLSKHMDVQGLDLWRSKTLDEAMARAAAVEGAGNVKRVHLRKSDAVEWFADGGQGLSFIEPWVELKTIWHPVGL